MGLLLAASPEGGLAAVGQYADQEED